MRYYSSFYIGTQYGLALLLTDSESQAEFGGSWLTHPVYR